MHANTSEVQNVIDLDAKLSQSVSLFKCGLTC